MSAYNDHEWTRIHFAEDSILVDSTLAEAHEQFESFGHAAVSRRIPRKERYNVPGHGSATRVVRYDKSDVIVPWSAVVFLERTIKRLDGSGRPA